jgi:hypothetical protein
MTVWHNDDCGRAAAAIERLWSYAAIAAEAATARGVVSNAALRFVFNAVLLQVDLAIAELSEQEQQ